MCEHDRLTTAEDGDEQQIEVARQRGEGLSTNR
jgi:hypothetical protein